MNPELPNPRPNIENIPQVPGGVETQPDRPEHGFEVAPIPEQGASSAETLAQPSTAMPMIDPATIATPVIPAPVTAQDDSSQAADADMPLVASDSDLIEKEWVDKVKRMISLTKGDPYERGRVITQLQAEYLKKRFNKTLGQSDE